MQDALARNVVLFPCQDEHMEAADFYTGIVPEVYIALRGRILARINIGSLSKIMGSQHSN
ncbi:hypothetical protein AUR04nite_31070 [Glutamicibacter uratoxydans]|uniref:Uncharacterized protein n=1 Tax=Glutamicibacter uratoxydans TaxID=43667 RepID=A0A4Y4DVE5_GLUUR|nr:hypothetical protein AUR04nite_31070 [Glutamicibacter uratoxydans]